MDTEPAAGDVQHASTITPEDQEAIELDVRHTVIEKLGPAIAETVGALISRGIALALKTILASADVAADADPNELPASVTAIVRGRESNSTNR